MSCPRVHKSFVFGLELCKNTSSVRLEFHAGDVLILCGFAAVADGGVHVLRGKHLLRPRGTHLLQAPVSFCIFSVRKKGGKSSQRTVGHVQQRSFPSRGSEKPCAPGKSAKPLHL